MYELIILALLMRGPTHGYRIAKVINDFFGPFTKLSSGRLYPLLATLTTTSFIVRHGEAAPPGPATGRRIQAYAITELGRRRFHQLMLDTASNPGDYPRLFQLKATMLDMLTSDEQRRLIDHYHRYCQANISHLTAEIADFASLAPNERAVRQADAIVAVLQHRIAQWQLELRWAEQLNARETAAPTADP